MRRFSLFFILFSLLLTGSPVSAVDTSTAIFTWKSQAPLDLNAVLAHFEVFDRELTTLTAHFSQSLSVKETGMSSTAEGSLSYLKPEQLRIEHTRPERQTVVADGKDIWIHRHSREQVIQSDLAAWKRSDPTINNLMQFGNFAKLFKTYDTSLDWSTGRPTLVLKSKDKAETAFQLDLVLNGRTLFPDKTILTVGTMVVETAMSAILFNPPLGKKVFEFKIPPGADVFRDFKPPRFQ